jgi:transcriptional regulator with PAS, ATPase and Fis domain
VQEIVNIRKNGEHFPCVLSASILRNEQGDPIGYMGISRDITEQKRAEAALRESQHYARSIIESSLDMIISADLNRNIVEFNTAAQKPSVTVRKRYAENPLICYMPMPMKPGNSSCHAHRGTICSGNHEYSKRSQDLSRPAFGLDSEK